MDLFSIIMIAVIGCLVTILLIYATVFMIYNKVTEKQFREERIKRIMANKEPKDPFLEFQIKEE